MSECHTPQLPSTPVATPRRRPRPAHTLNPPPLPRPYGRYVGRVGALALALGIGLATATGHGLGIAHADSTTDTSTTTDNDTTTTNDPATTADTDTLTTTTNPTTADSPRRHTRATHRAPVMNVRSSGGSNTSTTDTMPSRRSRSGDNAIVQAEKDTEAPGTAQNTEEPTATTASTASSTPEPTATAVPTASVTAPPLPGTPAAGNTHRTPSRLRTAATRQRHAEVADIAGLPASDHSTPATPDGASLNVIEDNATPTAAASINRAEALSLPTLEASLPTSTIFVETPDDTHRPAPTTHPVAALIAAPFRLAAGLLTTLITPGPAAPTQPPVLLAVLAWVGREIQRTYFNGTPIASDQSTSLTVDDPDAIPDAITLDVDDRDHDGLSFTITAPPTLGSATIDPATHTLTYDPNDDLAPGTYTDTITYTVTDENPAKLHFHGLRGLFAPDGGHTDTATVTVTLTVENSAPEAVDDNYSVDEDDVLLISPPGVLANDVDPNGDALGAPTLVSGPTQARYFELQADGTVIYWPKDNFVGTDSFTYTTSDGELTSNTATVTITVTPVNDVPFARADTYTTAEDTTLTITDPASGVLANDIDYDNDTLTVASVGDTAVVSGTPTTVRTAGGSLTITADGTFTYTPDQNFSGRDSFTYTATDGEATSGPATVTIDVTPEDDAPVAVDQHIDVSEDTPVTFAAHVSDPDGGTLTLAPSSGPAHGTVTYAGTDITYNPDQNYSGADEFTYIVTDDTGLTATAEVTVTVSNVDDAPVAVNQRIDTLEDTAVTFSAQVSDPDIDATLSLSTDPDNAPAHGSVSYTGTSITYDPDENFSGSDEFSYVVTDDSGLTATATVTVNVSAQNDAPEISVDGDQTTDEFGVVTGTLIVVDPDGDAVQVAGAVDPALGSVEVTQDPDNAEIYHYTFTPDGQFQVDLYNIDPTAAFTNIITFTATSTEADDSHLTDSTGVQVTIDPAYAAITASITSEFTYGDPYAVTSGPNGYVYVTTENGGSIVVIDPRDGTDDPDTGYRIVTTVDGAAAVDDIVVDDDGYVYVLVSGLKRVSVYAPDPDSAAGFSLAATRTVGNNPRGLTLDDDGYLYVANTGSTTVSVIDTNNRDPQTGYQIVTIAAGKGPTDVAVDDDGYLYVSNTGGSNTVSVIDTNDRDPQTGYQIVATIQVGTYPQAVTVGPAGYIYVANLNGDSVTVIDPGDRSVDNGYQTTTISGFDGPISIAVDDAGRIYVANSYGASVSIVEPGDRSDTETGYHIVAAVAADGPGPSQPRSVADRRQRSGLFHRSRSRLTVGCLRLQSHQLRAGRPTRHLRHRRKHTADNQRRRPADQRHRRRRSRHHHRHRRHHPKRPGRHHLADGLPRRSHHQHHLQSAPWLLRHRHLRLRDL